jgi:hypothetical protein
MRKTFEYFRGFLVSTQRFLHELFLGKTDPPLARLTIFGVEDFFTHSIAGFLTDLCQVLTHQVWGKFLIIFEWFLESEHTVSLQALNLNDMVKFL